MPLKPPTGTADAIARYVRAATGDPPLTGTQLRAGTSTGSRPRRLESRPECFMCRKPVEEFDEEEGFLDRFVVFTARCHGQTQRVKVELEMIQDQRVKFGYAFGTEPALEAFPAQRALPPHGDPRETPHAFEEDEEDDLCHACRGCADDPIHRVPR